MPSISLNVPAHPRPYCPPLSHVRSHIVIRLPWVYWDNVRWILSFKKADWSLFTRFIKQLWLQLKFSCLRWWKSGMWGGGGGVGDWGAVLLVIWQSPPLMYFYSLCPLCFYINPVCSDHKNRVFAHTKRIENVFKKRHLFRMQMLFVFTSSISWGT